MATSNDNHKSSLVQLAFVLFVSFFVVLTVSAKDQNLGRSVITGLDKAAGEINLRNGGTVYLTQDTQIFGQGERYDRHILKVGNAIQVYGVRQGENIRASRIDVYASTRFWSELNRH